jgi:hypothetical protein
MTEISFDGTPTGMGPKGAWVFLDFPVKVTKALGTKGRAPIVLSVGGKEFRVSAFPDGQGGHQISFNKEMQAASRWRAGEPVRASVAPDERPRIVAVPRDLKVALAKAPKARAAFEGFAPSHRKAYVDWIEEAKRPETRERRVKETVARLLRGERWM